MPAGRPPSTPTENSGSTTVDPYGNSGIDHCRVLRMYKEMYKETVGAPGGEPVCKDKVIGMKFMEEAIKEAREGILQKHGGPFGTVIVKDGRIVGRGHNRVLVNHDPTCHGEMEAIRDACRNMKNHDLSGCSLYTTAAPCPMCLGAILWSNISDVFYGCNTEDTDAIGFRDDKFYNDWNNRNSNSYGKELGRKECQELFAEYSSMEHDLY